MEKRLGIDPVGGIEAVVGRPVTELPRGRAEQTADGVLAQTDELSQQVGAQALGPALLGADRTGLPQELVEAVDQRVDFFLAPKGAAGA